MGRNGNAAPNPRSGETTDTFSLRLLGLKGYGLKLVVQVPEKDHQEIEEESSDKPVPPISSITSGGQETQALVVDEQAWRGSEIINPSDETATWSSETIGMIEADELDADVGAEHSID
jgi:hypothetical protein